MRTFATALDDYLHQIVRTRPWTKKREEAFLTSFSAWLAEQPDAPGELAAITPALSERYAVACGLAAAQCACLTEALHHFYAWAQYQGLVSTNPFATLVSA